MKQSSKNSKQNRSRALSLRDRELENLLRLAPEISDEQLSSLLADYAEKRKQRKKPGRSAPAKVPAASE